MHKNRFTVRKHALIISFISYACMLLAYAVRFIVLSSARNYGFDYYHLIALAAGALHYVVYNIFFYPDEQVVRRIGKQIQRTLLCEALCMGVTLSAMFVLRRIHFSRGAVFIHYVLCTVFISAYHAAVARLHAARHRRGVARRSVLLIGEGATATRYAGVVSANAEIGVSIVGCVGSDERHAPVPRFLGDYEHIEHVLCARCPDEAVIALPASKYIYMDAMIDACEKYGVPLRIIPCFEERISSHISPSRFEDIQMIGIRDIPLAHFGNAMIKRAFDIVLSLLLLALLWPLMLLIALGVKLSTGESVLFVQERVGKDKRPFNMLKFRSMKTNSAERVAWSKASDSRRTRFGALIRKLSLDELPQLLNVLRGEMSLIGPRPEIPHFVEQFRDEVPLYMIRHMVKPGMTGLAQVNGYRGDTSIRQRIEFDIAYIENWTIWVDVRILLRTFPALVNNEQLPRKKTT